VGRRGVRLLGLTVGRNEEYRYLKPMLSYMSGVLDEHFFYNDQSTDDTGLIAIDAGCRTSTRPDSVPRFMEDEGAFRAAAWAEFELVMRPGPGDWVLVIDCDEVIVATEVVDLDEYDEILALRTKAWVYYVARETSSPVDLNIPEVWGISEGCPFVRVDRLWGAIHAPRLFPYKPGGTFFPGKFGVPAVPQHVQRGPWANTNKLALMHYGYADPRDQSKKYDRYSGQQGHSNQHVESIVAKTGKEFAWWTGPYVKAMKQLVSL